MNTTTHEQAPEVTSDETQINTQKSNENQAREKSLMNTLQNERLLGVISYLGVLWIVPLAVAKDNEFAMYHANQGLVLFAFEIIVTVLWIIPFLGFLGWLVSFVLAVIGIINVFDGEQKALPFIGKHQLLPQVD